MIDALDTLYIMELEEEFQEAKQWVEKSFDLNVVSQLLGMPACATPSASPDHSLPLESFGEGNHELYGGRNHPADFLSKAKGSSAVIHPNFLLVPAGATSSASPCLADKEVQSLMVLVFCSGLWEQTLPIRHSKEMLSSKNEFCFISGKCLPAVR